MPPKVLTEKEVQASLAKAAPAAAAPGASSAAPAIASAPSASAAPAKTLPKTASNLTLVGLVGFASLVAGLGLSMRRRLLTR